MVQNPFRLVALSSFLSPFRPFLVIFPSSLLSKSVSYVIFSRRKRKENDQNRYEQICGTEGDQTSRASLITDGELEMSAIPSKVTEFHDSESKDDKILDSAEENAVALHRRGRKSRGASPQI